MSSLVGSHRASRGGPSTSGTDTNAVTIKSQRYTTPRDSARGDDAARKPWQSLSMNSATVYWRHGCPFCLKLRLGLRLTRTPHQLVNVREDPEASAFVKRHNGGDEVVPTVAVGDRVLNNRVSERYSEPSLACDR